MLLAQEPAQSIQQSENVYENHMHTSEAARKGIRFCPPSAFFSLDAGIEYSRKHCGGAGELARTQGTDTPARAPPTPNGPPNEWSATVVSRLHLCCNRLYSIRDLSLKNCGIFR